MVVHVKEQGFSVLELLLVMMVIGILAAAALPRLAAVERLALEHEALLLASELRWLQQNSMNVARGNAAFSSAPYGAVPQLTFSLGENGSYRISLRTNIVRKHQFANDVGVIGNYGAISFDGDGYINRPVTILLRRGAQDKAVVVDRVGRIRIE